MKGEIQLKWNPNDLEVRTRSIEEQLEPLVIQVTTLVNKEKSAKKSKGKSKKASVLVAAVEKAINNFVEKGKQIADENPSIGEQMLSVIEEIRSSGNIMIEVSGEFAASPCDSQKRVEMVKAARSLLGAVTRLLILADMIDVQLLLNSVKSVEAKLEQLGTAKPGRLLEEVQECTRKLNDLLIHAAKRQHELKDPQLRDDLAAARAWLKKSSTMLLSASKAYVAHPDVPAAKANKDQVVRQICQAVEVINDAAQGKAPKSSTKDFEGKGKLAYNLEALQSLDALNYKEVKTKTLLEQQLEELVNGAMIISDASNVRDERKAKIVDGCNALKEALQSLLAQSMKNVDTDEAERAFREQIQHLRWQLRKAVADKVAGCFSDTSTPLLALLAAAEKGDEQETETRAIAFHQHSSELIETANRVCDMSNNEDGVKMVRYAASQVATLIPEVINAARLLARKPKSAPAKDSMNEFKRSWENQVKLLSEAIDDIIAVDDILSVLDSNMYDDINKYREALQSRNTELMRQIAESIKVRSERIIDIVTSDMDNYEPCLYTKKVLEAIKVLNDQLIPNFDQRTERITNALKKNPEENIDESEFFDATMLVYDGIRDVRRAVLMNRADEDLDPEEVELEDNYATDTLIKTVTQQSTEENKDDMSGITVAREAMNKLSDKERNKIMTQVENFQSEKLTFDREVAKWDEASNDIVALAKHMCLIMMTMTDFVRQRGPLKTTTDVINAAKKISEYGTKLDKLTRQVADQCPEGSTKQDLLAYIERVALYSHQINIIAKVKADVQSNNDDALILAGVESATSLIENAKNLMNAVVLTVKASYVASSKYSRQGKITSSIVVWKMKTPAKKPLVRLEKPQEVRAVVRKSSTKKPPQAIRVLADFQM